MSDGECDSLVSLVSGLRKKADCPSEAYKTPCIFDDDFDEFVPLQENMELPNKAKVHFPLRKAPHLKSYLDKGKKEERRKETLKLEEFEEALNLMRSWWDRAKTQRE